MTVNDALEGHRKALQHAAASGFPGIAGIINMDGLHSAVAQPYNGYHRTIADKAAVLVNGIVRNHPFVDANKRTPLYALGLLLDRSGYDFNDSSPDFQLEIAQLIEALAARAIDRDKFRGWIAANIRQRNAVRS